MEKKIGKKGKRVLIVLAALVVAVLIGRGFMPKPAAAPVEEKYIPVEVEAAAKKTLINTAILSGKVSSDTDVSVVPEVTGKVDSVMVKVGDSVKKDEVLFTFDSAAMQNTYDLAAARYENSKEQWESAKASLSRTRTLASDKIAKAQKDLENTKTLYQAGAVSKDQLDQAELALKDLEATYNNQIEQLEDQASDSTLQLAQVQLTQARDDLDHADVKAPVDGVVSQVNVTVGNTAATGQEAISLTNTQSLYSTISVAENIVNHLATGNTVKVTVPAVSDQSSAGKITYISPSADPKTLLFPLKITMDNPKGLIKPGMFDKVELTTEKKAGVMAIKSEAVVLKNGKTIVYVVEGNKAVAKEVTTGLDTGVDVEILKGLTLNDQVIVKGQTLVDQGSKVKIVGGDAS